MEFLNKEVRCIRAKCLRLEEEEEEEEKMWKRRRSIDKRIKPDLFYKRIMMEQDFADT
jgi:hypothetical protein